MNKKDIKWVIGHKITPVEVSGNYDMVLGETPGNIPGPPPHKHLGFDEVFLVTKGEMEFVINGESKTIKSGESVDLPRGTVHTFSNKSESECTWINIHSPKGFLSFFEDLGIPIDEEDAMAKSFDKPAIDKVMDTAANYDMHIITKQ
jgi:mannose-6-phosphate isomerase-like protein (cupin superfamily)